MEIKYTKENKIRKKKVLIATGIFPPEIGGPATLAPEMASRLQADGYTVRLITYSDTSSSPDDMKRGYKIIRIVRAGKISNFIRFFIAILKEARDVDFIYTFDWVTAGLPIALATRLVRIPFIVRVGGGYAWEKYLQDGNLPITLKKFYSDGVYKKYFAIFLVKKFVFSKAHHVIFNSEIQKKIYETYYNSLIGKTSVILNPINRIEIEVPRDPKKITNEIVFAGRFIVMKNVETLIQAFAGVLDTELHLLLIGSGPLEQKLKKLVHDLHLDSRVTFLDSLAQNELYRRIIQCRYMVLPSWTDVSPNQVGEAHSLGIPVLFTQEQYLPINCDNLTMIDPNSFTQIQKIMNTLSINDEYQKFVHEFNSLHIPGSWDNFMSSHKEIFQFL